MMKVGTVDKVCCQRAAVFDWKIDNFPSRLDDLQYPYLSPEFNFCGLSWYLEFVLGDEVPQRTGYIGLYLYLNGSSLPNEVRCSLGIRTANGDTEVWDTFTTTFDKCDEFGSETITDLTELFRRRDELLPLDVLTLTATLKVGREVASKKGVKDVSVQIAVEFDGEDEPTEKTGGKKVLQDILNLWTNGENCDVLLKVGDVEFKAHRTILAARTPVLCAMFQHNTVEKTTGEVTIDDCEPAVFEQLLHYIYTGAPSELTAENASALYVLADKYLLNELKAVCMRCMQDTLCLDTFCDTVKLSLTHTEDDLLKKATDFLSRNMISVMKTVEWQRFLHEHTTWANEIHICAMEMMEARNERERRTVADLSPA